MKNKRAKKCKHKDYSMGSFGGMAFVDLAGRGIWSKARPPLLIFECQECPYANIGIETPHWFDGNITLEAYQETIRMMNDYFNRRLLGHSKFGRKIKK